MKIDRNLYRSFKNKIEGDLTIKDMVKTKILMKQKIILKIKF